MRPRRLGSAFAMKHDEMLRGCWEVERKTPRRMEESQDELENLRGLPGLLATTSTSISWPREQSWTKRQLGFLALFLAFLLYIQNQISSSFLHPFVKVSPSDSTSNDFAVHLHPEDHIFRYPTTIHYIWRVTSGIRFPDGVKKRVYLINGKPSILIAW